MLSAGIVGLPNVGKSTLFNAVTQSRKAMAANYRFCTIEPNQGIVTVPDDRLEVLSNISHSQKVIPAIFEFVDIAGLVKGASAGEGLGNPDANPWVAKVRDYVAHHHGTRAVVVSAEIESELVTLPPDERVEYLAGLGVEQGGSATLAKEAYYLLGLRTYLTTGEKE